MVTLQSNKSLLSTARYRKQVENLILAKFEKKSLFHPLFSRWLSISGVLPLSTSHHRCNMTFSRKYSLNSFAQHCMSSYAQLLIICIVIRNSLPCGLVFHIICFLLLRLNANVWNFACIHGTPSLFLAFSLPLSLLLSYAHVISSRYNKQCTSYRQCC